MPNTTQNYLLANTPISTIAFSAVVSTSSVYLNGPGGVSGDGFALPRRGYLTGLTVWDGSLVRGDATQITFDAFDRVSIYCQNVGPDFSVKVRLNGVSQMLHVTGVPHSSTLQAVLEFMLVRT